MNMRPILRAVNWINLESADICLGKTHTNLQTDSTGWIFFLGQGTQGTWSLPPPKIIVYLNRLYDSNSVFLNLT